jgi:hypothetical protein
MKTLENSDEDNQLSEEENMSVQDPSVSNQGATLLGKRETSERILETGSNQSRNGDSHKGVSQRAQTKTVNVSMVRTSTPEEVEAFREQERERYRHPGKAWIYRLSDNEE